MAIHQDMPRDEGAVVGLVCNLLTIVILVIFGRGEFFPRRKRLQRGVSFRSNRSGIRMCAKNHTSYRHK